MVASALYHGMWNPTSQFWQNACWDGCKNVVQMFLSFGRVIISLLRLEVFLQSCLEVAGTLCWRSWKLALPSCLLCRAMLYLKPQQTCPVEFLFAYQTHTLTTAHWCLYPRSSNKSRVTIQISHLAAIADFCCLMTSASTANSMEKRSSARRHFSRPPGSRTHSYHAMQRRSSVSLCTSAAEVTASGACRACTSARRRVIFTSWQCSSLYHVGCLHFWQRGLAP
mmetsp:Transcript_48890/g.86092  ORF Transcript_48890/g.86092 Transcript_48890/m.86092 type:complete len:224 (+) Transcript_48890:10-681(+)